MSNAQIKTAARMAAQWWRERLETGDKDAFENYLAAAVEKALCEREPVFLRCDYDPEGVLLDAVRAAGVECTGFMFSGDGILPRKHDLTVYADRLEPKEGYGNWRPEIAVPAPDEAAP